MSLSSRFLAGVGRCTRICNNVQRAAWSSGEGVGVRSLRVGGQAILSKPFSDVFSAEPRPAPDRIQPLLAMIWSHSPTNIIPFSLYCKIPGDRWKVRGLRIFGRRKRSAFNVVVVSGTRGQDPSTIGVNMCVAAALSRGGAPLVDVSVVPVAYPREYERVWKSEQCFNEIKQYVSSSNASNGNFHLSPVAPRSNVHDFDSLPSREQIPEVNLQGLDHNEDDVCTGPLKNYLARFGGHYVNLDLDISKPGASLVFKGSKWPKFTDGMKFRPAQIEDHDGDDATSSPSHPASPSLREGLCLGDVFGLLDPVVHSPTYVIHLKNSNQIKDEQLEPRAEEVLRAIQTLTERVHQNGHI